MKILVIHGPNLNMLGKRDPIKYGHLTLELINEELKKIASNHDITISFFQSNHEGKLIDYIQKNASSSVGILINPAAFTHYSIALRDSLLDTRLPIVEVHLSDITTREDFRKSDVLDGIVVERVMGLKEKSYSIGLKKLIKHLTNNS